jgi:dienelactone hydrolase
VLVLATATATATACGGARSNGGGSSPSPPPHPTVAAQCRTQWEDGKGTQVWFTDTAGASIGGVEMGSGTTGVVLAHEAGSDSCRWIPYGLELAAAGYRVLAFDFSGSGVSPDLPDNDSHDGNVLGALAFLRHEGATKAVLMGASMGGTASLVAASKASPPVAGVVSLSAALSYESMDAYSAAGELAVPVLFVAGTADEDFSVTAHTLYEATPGSAKTLLLLQDSAMHGTALLAPGLDDSVKVRAAIQDFLKAHAPVSG